MMAGQSPPAWAACDGGEPQEKPRLLRLRADRESPTLMLTGYRLSLSIAWNGILESRRKGIA